MITDAPPAAPSRTLWDLVSADVGAVHRVDDGVVPYDHPRLPSSYALLADMHPLTGATLDTRSGGTAGSIDRARLAALGEAVERYSAAHVPTELLRLAQERDLAPDPVAGPLWRDSATDRPQVHWVRGERLRAGLPSQPTWVAASRVYLARTDLGTGVLGATSTGLACHTDPWQALYSALLETIERDAFMVSWITENGLTPLHGPLRWRDPDSPAIDFDRAVQTYQLFRLDSPVGVPVALAVVWGSGEEPPVAVGAAADLDLVRAARKALIEAHQTYAWMVMSVLQDRTPAAAAADVRVLDDHPRFYLDRANLPAFDYVLRAARHHPAAAIELARPADQPDARARCDQLVSALDAAGMDSFAVDVTSPDVRNAGAWVIRAVVPGLYPLLVGGNIPNHPRVPASLARRRAPHPFP